MSTVELFHFSSTSRSLCNIFSTKQIQLSKATVHDLLNVSAIGNERMFNYIKQHILKVDPICTKRNKKLSTFTPVQTTVREQRTKINQLTNIVQNAMQALQLGGISTQTSPFPLAISDMGGKMRMGQKSNFREALLKEKEFRKRFVHNCPYFDMSPLPTDLAIIIDLLYYIHMAPPPDVVTFFEYFSFLWDCVFDRYKRYCKYLYIVIDKPEYLPPPRKLVHACRKERAGSLTYLDPEISDSSPIPHSQAYTSLLSSSETFKCKLIQYISKKMIENALSTLHQLLVVIDSPAVQHPVMVANSTLYSYPQNKHGEADYAIWHHAFCTPASSVLVVSCDTDTWVYGLGIYETGYLGGKTVCATGKHRRICRY